MYAMQIFNWRSCRWNFTNRKGYYVAGRDTWWSLVDTMYWFTVKAV